MVSNKKARKTMALVGNWDHSRLRNEPVGNKCVVSIWRGCWQISVRVPKYVFKQSKETIFKVL